MVITSNNTSPSKIYSNNTLNTLFFEEVKMNYITTSKESFLAQDVLRKGHQSQTIVTIVTYIEREKKKKLLANAQNGKRTKPPPMVVEGKRSILRLQPRISKRLNLVDHLINRALFDIKQHIVSFLPYFPNCSKPNDLKNRAVHLCGTTTKIKLIKMIRHLKWGSH